MKFFKMKKQIRVSFLIAAAALTLCACTADPERFTLRDEGVELFEKGDYEAALEKFQASLDASKGEVSELQYDILKYSAECRLRLSDYEGARKAYEALMQLDESEEGQAQYRELLAEMDGMEVVRDAKKLIEEEEYDAALEMLEPLAKLDGSITGKTAWFDRAVCIEYQQHYEEAAELFSEYLKKYPDDAAADKEYRFCSSR